MAWTEAEKKLREIHGNGTCHICVKPMAEEGLSICSYPHGMMPVKAVDAKHPDGFWVWEHQPKHLIPGEN